MTSADGAAGLWEQRRDGDVLIATYTNGPMNYLTQPAVHELEAMVTSWRSTTARVIVLTGGAPGVFITHFDVEQILSAAALSADELTERDPERNAQVDRILGILAELPQPVIAALNGDAMGAGFELALACDLRVAADGDFRIGPCEVALGIIPGSGGTQRLIRAVGMARALDLVLRAKVLTPAEAAELGLVSDVVEDALAGTLDIARYLARMPAIGLAMAKRTMHLGAELPLAYALQIESEASLRTKFSSSSHDAMEAYVALPLSERRDVFDAWRRTA